ncbi:MAG TPA: hypothetical protein VEV17_05700 [Bryobacteraceae bacterium]|nr:hypothetical protein [Bryobacteraceae bacterium]
MNGSLHLSFQTTLDAAPPGWDEFYRGCGRVHPYQTAGFGAWERFRGNRVAYLELVNGSVKVGQCLVTISPSRVAMWYFGPVMKASTTFSLASAVDGLVQYLRSIGVIAIENASTPPSYNHRPPGDELRIGLHRQTLVIDLTQPDADLQKSFDRSVRKNLRKCRERTAQFSFSEGNGKALTEYVALLAAHRKKLGFSMPPFYPNPDSVRCFAGTGSRLFVALASLDGAPVAGLGFVLFGELAVEVGVAQSASYDALRLPLHDFIKAEACRALAAAGAKIYDLAGISTQPRGAKEENIRRFKQKFSSHRVDYRALTMRFQPIQYYYVRAAAKLTRVCRAAAGLTSA